MDREIVTSGLSQTPSQVFETLGLVISCILHIMLGLFTMTYQISHPYHTFYSEDLQDEINTG